jgi:hypothetical protein
MINRDSDGVACREDYLGWDKWWGVGRAVEWDDEFEVRDLGRGERGRMPFAPTM